MWTSQSTQNMWTSQSTNVLIRFWLATVLKGCGLAQTLTKCGLAKVLKGCGLDKSRQTNSRSLRQSCQMLLWVVSHKSTSEPDRGCSYSVRGLSESETCELSMETVVPLVTLLPLVSILCWFHSQFTPCPLGCTYCPLLVLAHASSTNHEMKCTRSASYNRANIMFGHVDYAD